MKELEMPKELYLEKYDLHIRPYLTCEEIVSIGELAIQAENPIEQEMTIALNVLVCCTDLTEDEARELDLDVILYSGLWDEMLEIIKNITSLYDYIAYFESANIAIARFLNKTIPDMAQEYIDKLPKDGEWEKVIEKLPTSLNQVLEVVKEDGNADIIRGALKMGEK
jgi:hypothetical protein